MCKIILIYVPIEGDILHSYVHGFLICSGKALPFPAYNVEVVQCGGVAYSGLVAIYR